VDISPLYFSHTIQHRLPFDVEKETSIANTRFVSTSIESDRIGPAQVSFWRQAAAICDHEFVYTDFNIVGLFAIEKQIENMAQITDCPIDYSQFSRTVDKRH
jgi:hypothetical protein